MLDFSSERRYTIPDAWLLDTSALKRLAWSVNTTPTAPSPQTCSRQEMGLRWIVPDCPLIFQSTTSSAATPEATFLGRGERDDVQVSRFRPTLRWGVHAVAVSCFPRQGAASLKAASLPRCAAHEVKRSLYAVCLHVCCCLACPRFFGP